MSGIIDGTLEIIRDNFLWVALLAIGALVGLEMGWWEWPGMPAGSGLVVMAAAVVAIVGWIMGGKIHDLLPEEEGIYLVSFDASDGTGGSVYEVTEDTFEDMDVVAGELFQWPATSKRVYEVREYRPEPNEAVGNWRESIAASELAGNHLVTDAMEQIDELRSIFEPESRKFRILKRRMRGIARKMDIKRAEDQQRILDEHLAPDFDADSASVSDIINEEIPEELRPESMKGDDQEGAAGVEEEPEEFAGFDLLQNGDGEALSTNE